MLFFCTASSGVYWFRRPSRAIDSESATENSRAFVYSNEEPEDRAKQAYNEFKPLDGKFESNVLIQVKNGAIDFQPREPFHPLFGAMEQTPLMMEFQVTQEYLGQGIHLTYLAPLYKECLISDTYAKGEQSYVSKVIDPVRSRCLCVRVPAPSREEIKGLLSSVAEVITKSIRVDALDSAFLKPKTQIWVPRFEF